MVTVEFNRLNIRPGSKILDIGCGSGRHTCAAYTLPGVIAVGADLKAPDTISQDRATIPLERPCENLDHALRIDAKTALR